ncbi:MAG: hypothetical protein OXU20_39460 [Myxococcales bacterium]|nr:hypothetical protein [Myxococcales bacterium]MDD9968526.1 hypothetical protein [Myxococcales bacterium]
MPRCLRYSWRVAVASAVAVTVSAWPTVSGARPSGSLDLWDLTVAADVIVIADIERLESEDPARSDPTRAVLRVQEVWKGQASPVVTVHSRKLGCPASPRYEEGREVLAFLRGNGREPLTTARSSIGVVYLVPGARPAFRDLIRRAVAVLGQTTDEHALSRARLGWAVQAVVDPITRGKGLDVLSRSSRRTRTLRRPDVPSTLPASVQGKLAQAIEASPTLDYNLVRTLNLLAGYPSSTIDSLAVAAVDTALAAEAPPRWGPELVRATVARVAPDRPMPDLWQVEPLLHGEPPPEILTPIEVLRGHWKQVRASLPMPRRPLKVTGP